ncbi:hypothetical protein EsH8_III_001092 [Colletotrichum jinshuiense]
MHCSTIAVLGLAAVARATWDGQFSYPPGIEPLALANGNVDFNIKTFGPLTGPSADCISVWHPPHKDVYIDDCDNDKEHGWHWVHPGKPKWKKPGKDKDHGGHKTKKHGHDQPTEPSQTDEPEPTSTPEEPAEPTEPTEPEEPEPTTTPQWKWTTSTITQTAISTVYSCAPTVTDCPGNGGGTMYETVTVPAIVTICPVPVEPTPVEPTPVPTVPVAPPATTAPPAEEPVPSNPSPPETLSSVYIPPVSSSPPESPPATTTAPNIGTVTRPNPTATTSRVVVTAGAVPNVQRAGGVVVAAVAAAAAAFI